MFKTIFLKNIQEIMMVNENFSNKNSLRFAVLHYTLFLRMEYFKNVENNHFPWQMTRDCFYPQPSFDKPTLNFCMQIKTVLDFLFCIIPYF